jgi:hypothetical protein
VAMLREMGGFVEGDGWLSLREMGGSLGSNPDTSPKKWKNGRHKQRIGEHTLARQQNIHKNKPLIKIRRRVLYPLSNSLCHKSKHLKQLDSLAGCKANSSIKI